MTQNIWWLATLKISVFDFKSDIYASLTKGGRRASKLKISLPRQPLFGPSSDEIQLQTSGQPLLWCTFCVCPCAKTSYELLWHDRLLFSDFFGFSKSKRYNKAKPYKLLQLQSVLCVESWYKFIHGSALEENARIL